MSAKKLGMTTVIDQAARWRESLPTATCGDLSSRVEIFPKSPPGDLASRNPKPIGPDDLAAKAVEMMERYSITTLVVDGNSRKQLSGSCICMIC